MEHVERTGGGGGGETNLYTVLMGGPERGDHLQGLGFDGRIILK